ncbi:MAG: hypothetical protein R3281_04495 [Balneolaceae bacterium]|nr:hypothetical protein [Balneolaceae bacterium]
MTTQTTNRPNVANKQAILLFSFILLLLFPLISSAQYGNPRIEALYNSGNFVEGPEFIRNVNALKIRPIHNVEGTRYYNEEWLPGEIVLIDNVRTENLDLKMDALNNQVHFKVDENQILGLNSENVRSFYLQKGDEKIYFLNGYTYPRAGITSETFLRVVHQGESVSLLAHHTAEIRESRTSIVATAGSVSGNFVHRTDYYLQKNNGELQKVRKLKKKHVLREFEEYDDELERFADQNDLDFRNEKDVAKILAHFDKLSTRSSR